MKARLWVIGCVVLALFLSRTYLHPNFPYTHDGENHLARFANYKLAVRQGQFPPRWAPNLVHGYGYPVFNFNYPLANMLSVPFAFVKVPYQAIFVLIVFGSVLSLVFGSLRWLKLHGTTMSGQIVALSSLAASPVLVSLLVFRGSIGEIVALGIFPWLLYGIDTILAKNSVESARSLDFSVFGKTFLLSSSNLFFTLMLTAFLLSHNITVLLAIPILGIYTLGRRRFSLPGILSLAWSIVLAVLLTFWFWLPALTEQSEIVLGGAGLSQQIAAHAVTWNQLWVSPTTFGYSYLGQVDSAALSLGMWQLVVLVLATITWKWHWLREKNPDIQIGTILALLWILTLGQLGMSTGLWQLLPFGQFVQFPWRLAVLQTVFFLPIIAAFWKIWPAQIRKLLMLGLVLQIFAMMHVFPVDRFSRPNASYELFPQSTSTANENLPREFTLAEFGDQPVGPVFLSAAGKSSIKTWNGSDHQYTLSISQPGVVVEPTARFLGWQTRISDSSGQNATLLPYVDSQTIAGRIAFEIDRPGEYRVESRFTQHSPARIIGNTLSFVTFIAIFFWGIFLGTKNWKKRISADYA